VGVFGADNLFRHKLGNVIGFPLTTTRGQWLPNDLGFAGIRVTTAGGPHLGWIRIRLEDTNSDGFTNRLTVVDYAYNDVAGASIQAGDTGSAPVPEPSSKAMALLAAGAIGVLAWRKRRQAA
jgi:hypothetical protein